MQQDDTGRVKQTKRKGKISLSDEKKLDIVDIATSLTNTPILTFLYDYILYISCYFNVKSGQVRCFKGLGPRIEARNRKKRQNLGYTGGIGRLCG